MQTTVCCVVCGAAKVSVVADHMAALTDIAADPADIPVHHAAHTYPLMHILLFVRSRAAYLPARITVVLTVCPPLSLSLFLSLSLSLCARAHVCVCLYGTDNPSVGRFSLLTGLPGRQCTPRDPWCCTLPSRTTPRPNCLTLRRMSNYCTLWRPFPKCFVIILDPMK